MQMNPRDYLVWLLSRKDYSRPQLEKKLKARGIESNEIEALLEDLIQKGLFNEAAFQKSRTRQLIKRGLGASAVKYRLKADQCIVTDQDIAQAFEEIGTDPREELKKQVERVVRRLLRKGGLTPREMERKVAQSLAPKGHKIQEIIELVREVTQSESASAP